MGASVVDLFCGAGGLTHGFILEGISVSAGIDLDPACRHPFEHNNQGARFVLGDVSKLTGSEVAALYPTDSTRILAGCAPCQPFSPYTGGRDTSKDERWGLLHAFARLVAEVRPTVVTMENVTRLAGHGVYADFIVALERLGYHVTDYHVYCPKYGVPQTRRRLVLFASTSGPVLLVPPTHGPNAYPTVRSAIEHLEPLGAGDTSNHDPLHKARRLTSVNVDRIQASRPGGTWRDWAEGLVAECHRKATGSSYHCVYGRMEWDQPAPTITTECFNFGTGRFGHPNQDRPISLREAALLQTFPDGYEFVPPSAPTYFKTVGRLVGNAVPVRLAQAIARSIRAHLEENDG